MATRARVSILFPEQYEQAAVVLARAFVRDPAMMAILPESVAAHPDQRIPKIADVFRSALAIQRHDGEPVLGVLDNGSVVGVAVIARGGSTSLLAILGFGLPHMKRMVQAVGWGGTMRGLKLMGELARNHPPQSHIYLNFLGVDPAHQGKHYGIALLEHLREMAMERADLKGVYLETANEANVPYYSSHGYKVIGEIHPLGVRFWRMFQYKGA
jgi:ribosomal protein S18 acetylase RimI-like enzyme